ncbi:MAG TPA: hypothetical protein VGD47_04460 [Steroidobacteraceae bacterium]
MPLVCAGRLLLYGVAATTLAGCAVSRLSPDAPPGLTLAGAWKLNRAASDDPQKLLDKMRAEAFRRMGRQVTAGPRPDARGAGTRTSQPEDRPLEEEPPPVHAARGAPRPDPLLRSPMARVLLASIARGDFLTVRQTREEFALDYGNSQRSFTPGARSVVSAEGGVADQTSGWKGREYVIEARAQLGPDVTERYGLSGDGKHLVEKLHISTEELSAVELTRVYDPTNDTAPRQLPTSD